MAVLTLLLLRISLCLLTQLLHGLRRDTYEIEVHTELEMLEARKKEHEQQQQQQQSKQTTASAASSSDPPRVERVILTTEDVTELLNMVDQDDEYLSDASDILFSIQCDNASLPGAGVLSTPILHALLQSERVYSRGPLFSLQY